MIMRVLQYSGLALMLMGPQFVAAGGGLRRRLTGDNQTGGQRSSSCPPDKGLQPQDGKQIFHIYDKLLQEMSDKREQRIREIFEKLISELTTDECDELWREFPDPDDDISVLGLKEQLKQCINVREDYDVSMNDLSQRRSPYLKNKACGENVLTFKFRNLELELDGAGNHMKMMPRFFEILSRKFGRVRQREMFDGYIGMRDSRGNGLSGGGFAYDIICNVTPHGVEGKRLIQPNTVSGKKFREALRNKGFLTLLGDDALLEDDFWFGYRFLKFVVENRAMLSNMELSEDGQAVFEEFKEAKLISDCRAIVKSPFYKFFYLETDSLPSRGRAIDHSTYWKSTFKIQ